jgi:hypothetical protein
MTKLLMSALLLLSSTVALAENTANLAISSTVSCNGAAIMDAGMYMGASFPKVRLEKMETGKYNLYYSQNEVNLEADTFFETKEYKVTGVKNFLIAEDLNCQFSTMKEVVRCTNLTNLEGEKSKYSEVNFRKIATYGVTVGGMFRVDDDMNPKSLDILEVEIETDYLNDDVPEYKAIKQNRVIKADDSSIKINFPYWQDGVCVFNP